MDENRFEREEWSVFKNKYGEWQVSDSGGMNICLFPSGILPDEAREKLARMIAAAPRVPRLEARVKELEAALKAAMADTARLDRLIDNSGLHHDTPDAIQLIVPKAVIANCAGTHLKQHHDAVRKALDTEER